MTGRLVIVALLGLAVAAPPASAGGVSPLGSRDRIAAAMSLGDDDRPLPDRRGSAVLYVVAGTTATPFHNDLSRIEWSPGAGSLFAVETANSLGAPTDVLVVEHPAGAETSLIHKFDALRPQQAGGALFPDVGWKPVGSPLFLFDAANGLLRVNPDGTGAALVSDNRPGLGDAAISPNGDRLAISRSNTQGRLDLFVLEVASGVLTQITNTPSVDERGPAWNKAGTRIAYAAGPDTTARSSRIEARNADGSNLVELAPEQSGFKVSEPTWRPDGQRVAYVRFEEPSAGPLNNPRLLSVSATGGDQRIHTPRDGAGELRGRGVGDLSWGATCVFVSSCSPGFQLVNAPQTGSVTLSAIPTVISGVGLGFLVERYRGRRLRVVGRVPFGRKRVGRPRLRWNLRLRGRRLAPARYRITLRSLAGRVPLELSRRIDLIVPSRGRPRLARARVAR